MNSIRFSLTSFWLVFAATALFCFQARAQDRAGNSSNGQKPSGGSVSAAQTLLQKALKNAKAAAPDDNLERADFRQTETKAPQPSTQPSLLPDAVSLPDGSRPDQLKQIPAAPPKETPAKPEPIKAPPGPEVRPDAEEKPNQVVESDSSVWEPTGITVSRVFLATDGANGAVRKVPISVPVYYESRTMALDKDKQRTVAKLLDKLVSYRTRLAAMKKEGGDLLNEWNQIMSTSTPQDLLLSDSPTLIDDAANRGPAAPGFEPGKGISVQVKSTGSNQ